MLNPQPSYHYHSRPKKIPTFDPATHDDYNEFKGQIQEEVIEAHDEKIDRGQEQVEFGTIQNESKRNISIYQSIKQGDKKIRKIQDAREGGKSKREALKIKKQQKQAEKAKEKEEVKVKIEQGSKIEEKPLTTTITKKQKKPQAKPTGTSNWQNFLTKSAASTDKPKNHKSLETVALDCEFVKHNQQYILARISIVNDKGQCILDSYVRPDKKVTDFLTPITGITFPHIKNAPDLKTTLEKVKKILYNKILVGHTIWKDLDVCGLTQWKGWKALIDICQYPPYKQQNGKLISLKNLSMKHLGRSIQEGRHSSLEDAGATLDLYHLHKTPILQHFKII